MNLQQAFEVSKVIKTLDGYCYQVEAEINISTGQMITASAYPPVIIPINPSDLQFRLYSKNRQYAKRIRPFSEKHGKLLRLCLKSDEWVGR